jgi:signal transduction histidine kinase
VHGPVLPKQSESLERIRTNQLRMAEMITEMMSYAQAACGTLRMRPEQAELAPRVLGVLSALSQTALAQNVHLRFLQTPVEVSAAAVSGPCGSVMVHADIVALDDVIAAVLRDAIECNAGGDVSLRLTIVGESAVLHVDGGRCALEPAACESLFTPFGHFERERGRHTIASALALPRARLLARAFGGDVVALPDAERRILQVHVPCAKPVPVQLVEPLHA